MRGRNELVEEIRGRTRREIVLRVEESAEHDLVHVGHDLEGLAHDEHDGDADENDAEVRLALLPRTLLGVDLDWLGRFVLE